MGLAALWEAGAYLSRNPLFPPLERVALALYQMMISGEMLAHVRGSLGHLAVGIGLAAIVGLALGIAITESAAVRVALTPVVDLMRPVAALSLFPLIILILGLGMWSKVFVIFWTAWPAILLNTVRGLLDVDPLCIEAASLDGCGRWGLLWFIRLPLALRTIGTGLRIGVSGGWISLVSAEMLGSNSGLGYATQVYSQTFRFPEMYAAVVMIGLVGLAANTGLEWVQTHFEREM